MGEALRLRWKCRFPGSVALNEDYWVFPMCFFLRLPDRVTLEARFTKIPADILFFSVVEGGLRPMNITGPIPNSSGGKPDYAYSVSTESSVGLFLLRWRLE
jgi:hypothetical protein